MKQSVIILKNKLDEAIKRYASDVGLWVKDKTNIDLRPTQIVHCEEMLKHPKILDLLPPRFGKSFEIAMLNLMESAVNPYEDGRIWAPKEAQAKESLKYQVDAIESSPILSKYIARKSGKRLISSQGYTFLNGSNWKAFGIYGNFEGENATILCADEFDDMDIDIWNTRAIPRGSAKNRNGLPTRIRLSGTIQEGKGNIYQIHENPAYYNLMKWDINAGLMLGLYDDDLIEFAKQNNTADAYKRIYLLKFTESKNFIKDAWLLNAQKLGLKYKLQLMDPTMMTAPYNPQGTVYGSLDMGASGTREQSSKYAAVFLERIGDTRIFLGSKTWPATESPDIVAREYCELFEVYGARYGMADALKADLARDINKILHARHLIRVNVDNYVKHDQTTWREWDFMPQWNQGEFKWLYGCALAKEFENGNIIFPYIDKKDDRPCAKYARQTLKVLANIKESLKSEKQRYPTLSAVNKMIGDDDYDAYVMAFAASQLKYRPIIDWSEIEVSGKRNIRREQSGYGIEIDRTGFEIDRNSF